MIVLYFHLLMSDTNPKIYAKYMGLKRVRKIARYLSKLQNNTVTVFAY